MGKKTIINLSKSARCDNIRKKLDAGKITLAEAVSAAQSQGLGRFARKLEMQAKGSDLFARLHRGDILLEGAICEARAAGCRIITAELERQTRAGGRPPLSETEMRRRREALKHHHEQRHHEGLALIKAA